MSRIFSVLLLLLFGLGTNAQVTFVTKTSSEKIGKDDLLEVSYEVQEGVIENFSEPRFPGWRLSGGPSVSSSTVITNGRRTSSMSYQFLLQPAETGKLKVPGAKATINGKVYISNAVTIEVSKKSTEGQTGNNTPDPLQLLPPDLPVPENVYEENDAILLRPNENIEAKTKKNVFAVAEVTKKTCYPGEAIRATYKLYSRASMDAHISKRPSFSGFSSIDLPLNGNSEFEYVTYNGKNYKMYTIRSLQLYPLVTGNQTLQPVEIDATIQYRKLPANTYSYDPLAGMEAVNYPFVIKSDPVNVTVLPFPDANKPVNFDGVTGNFSIESSVDYKELAKSEAGTLRVTIGGSGNWTMVQQPKINWPADVDVFEPTINEKLDSQSVPLTGKRIYEFPFTRNKAGQLVIPAISLSFFDAEKKDYATVSTQPISITIKNTSSPLHKTTVEYTKTKAVDGTEIFTGIVKIIFPLVALMLLIWFVIAYRKKQKNNQQEIVRKAALLQRDKPSQKNRYADLLQVSETPKTIHAATALDGLQNQQQSEPVSNINTITQQDYKPFTGTSKQYFSGLKNNLQILLKQHLNISEANNAATRQALLQYGMQPGNAEKIVNLLVLCDHHIYSPFAEAFDVDTHNQLYAEVKGIITAKV